MKKIQHFIKENNMETKKVTDWVTAFEFLGKPIGKEDGAKLYAKFTSLGLTHKSKEISNKKYTGKINMYPRLFLEIYFDGHDNYELYLPF
jgi:hypothetical protein